MGGVALSTRGKKAGIVTYAHCENYGAELQTCALNEMISRVSGGMVRSETIWFDRAGVTASERRKILVRGIVGRLKRNVLLGLLDIANLALKIVRAKIVKPNADVVAKLGERSRAFEDFWDKSEPHSPKVDSSQISGMGYDILVAGSDQIWNWRLTGDLTPYLLAFTPPPAKCERKISYAASVSVDKIDPMYEDLYRRGLAELDMISVRETHGREVLQRLSDKPIEVVLDPTLLLNSEDWSKFERNDLHVEGDYVLVYNLNSSKRFWAKVAAYAKAKGLKIVNIYGSSCAPEKYGVIEVMTAGPADFLHLIRHAKMVITNSFHGTIFSINFRIPFVSVLNPASSTNTRIQSIVKLLNLEHRVIFDDMSTELVQIADIDYDSVHKTLDSLRASSVAFLKKGICG